MELAGTGSSQANLTAEPAEAVETCSKQSRAVGWALPFIGGAGRGGGGEGGGSKAENRQQADKQKAAQRHTPRPPACFDLDEPTDGVDGDLKREEILPFAESHSFRRRVAPACGAIPHPDVATRRVAQKRGAGRPGGKQGEEARGLGGGGSITA